MTSYIIKRLLALIPVIVGVALVVFLIVHLIPGDPAQTMLGERATKEAIEQLRESMGLNEPLYVQFYEFFKSIGLVVCFIYSCGHHTLFVKNQTD